MRPCLKGHTSGRFADGHCKECRRQYERADRARALRRQKRWRERNPEKELARQRRADLKRNYGVTIQQYDEVLAAQSGVCAICRQPESTLRKGTLMRLSMDHDHHTGMNRGALCNRCNRAIGLIGDDVVLARALVDYLDFWRRGLQSVA
jgi:hypothetical protein